MESGVGAWRCFLAFGMSRDRALSTADGGARGPAYRASAASGPCSNDNPAWDEGTIPCPNVAVFDGVAETPDGENAGATGASDGYTDSGDVIDDDVADSMSASSPSDKSSTPPHSGTSPSELPLTEAVAATATPPLSQVPSTQSNGQPGLTVDVAGNNDFVTSAVGSASYPSFYSCSVMSEEELFKGSGGGTGSNNKELLLPFDYEMYTSTGVSDIASVLSAFERQLANGVAASLGLVDCPTALGSGEDRVSVVEFARGQRPPFGGRGRTLQTKHDGAGEPTNQFVGLSMEPLDGLDTELCESLVDFSLP